MFRKSCLRSLSLLASAGIGLACTTSFAQTTTPASPANNGSWEIFVSPYAQHWHYDEEHRHVYAVGVERIYEDSSLLGGSLFRNSFGQASGYLYYGHEWNDFLNLPGVYAKLSGGLMYGYRGKFQDKVPFNVGGFSPAVVPGLGYRITKSNAVQLDILGTAGVLFSYNHKF
jgi:hypothetical protein